MPEPGEYILGVDQEELERLHFQHKTWTLAAYEVFQVAGLRAGHTVLDLGCGPGFTSFELAHVVGDEGRVIARDQSARFLDFLRAECVRRSLRNIEASLGPVEDLALANDSLDAAYARWLFCWLSDPGNALALVARAVKPGGVIVLQEYFDWGAMRLMPASDIFDRSVQACMRSWHEGGGRIDVAADIPALAIDAGLRVARFRPRARIGAVGSLEWRWLGAFFRSYLPRLVERGSLRASDVDAHEREWQTRTGANTGFIYAPVMADIVLTKS